MLQSYGRLMLKLPKFTVPERRRQARQRALARDWIGQHLVLDSSVSRTVRTKSHTDYGILSEQIEIGRTEENITYWQLLWTGSWNNCWLSAAPKLLKSHPLWVSAPGIHVVPSLSSLHHQISWKLLCSLCFLSLLVGYLSFHLLILNLFLIKRSMAFKLFFFTDILPQ